MPQIGWVQTIDTCPFTAWSPEVNSQDVSRAPVPPKALRGIFSLSFGSWGRQGPLAPFYLYEHVDFFPESLSKFPSSLKDPVPGPGAILVQHDPLWTTSVQPHFSVRPPSQVLGTRT